MIELLAPTPLLIIAGSKAETLEQSQKAYEPACEPKELHLVDNGKHFDFYDRPDFVAPAIEKIELQNADQAIAGGHLLFATTVQLEAPETERRMTWPASWQGR